MPLKIAIQPDELVFHDGSRQSYSDRWFELASESDVEAVRVDVYSPDVLKTIAGCDAFMWRYDPSAQRRLFAARLLYAIEFGLGLPVFPSLGSRWHFEDKIGQYYFLAAAGIPTPATTVCWTREQAITFCDDASYPFVLKLATGFAGSNVRLMRTREEALFHVDALFTHGIISLGYGPAPRARLLLRRLRAASELIRGRNPYGPTADADLQYGYFLAQEFVPDNAFDIRVTIIGNRAFAVRRFNRPGDFRASGSHLVDRDPSQIGEDAIRLGFRVALASGAQTISVDILRSKTGLVVGELGLAYPQLVLREHPGHWVLQGQPDSGSLERVEGSRDPAYLVFADFVAHVRQSTNEQHR